MSPADTDVATLIVWIAALLTVLNAGTAVWNIFSSPAKRAEARMGEMSRRIEHLEMQGQRLADQIGQMPNLHTMHELEVMLVRMEGRLEQLNERLHPVSAIADRMQEWMLENGK